MQEQSFYPPAECAVKHLVVVLIAVTDLVVADFIDRYVGSYFFPRNLIQLPSYTFLSIQLFSRPCTRYLVQTDALSYQLSYYAGLL